MLPVIAEVVLIYEAAARSCQDLAERYPSLVHNIAVQLETRIAIRSAILHKCVRVAVFPAHNSLQNSMQFAECDFRR
jgi:hypothetical protein